MVNLLKKHEWIIFLIALIVRFAYILFFPQIESSGFVDAIEYNKIAESLISVGHFPGDVRWPPLFPLFLAGIYSLFGYNLFFVRLIQALISSFTCFLVYLIGKNSFDKKTGFISGLLAVFYPGFISYTGHILTETLSTFLITLAVYFLMKALSGGENKWKWYIFTGIILGLVSLCRSEMLFFPFFLALVITLIYQNKKQVLKGFTILLFAVVITISPWTARNYVLFHKFIPITVGFGRALWLGSYHEEWLGWYLNREPIKTLYRENNTIEFSEKLTKMGIENIRRHPFLYLTFCIKRFFRFWLTGHSNTVKGLEESFTSTIQNRKYRIFFMKLLFLFVNMGIIFLSFLGIFITRKHWRTAFLLLSAVIYKIILHSALYSSPRFQIHIMSLMLIFAAVGVQYIWYYQRCKNGGKPGFVLF